MAGAARGVHIIIANGTKDVVKVPANSFPRAKKLNTHGPVLSVVTNYMQEYDQLFFYGCVCYLQVDACHA